MSQTWEEIKELMKNEEYDEALKSLYKRGRKVGTEGLRVVTPKQVANAVDKLEWTTASDLYSYEYGRYRMSKDSEFGIITVIDRNTL